jgi:hypothetical protein
MSNEQYLRLLEESKKSSPSVIKAGDSGSSSIKDSDSEDDLIEIKSKASLD